MLIPRRSPLTAQPQHPTRLRPEYAGGAVIVAGNSPFDAANNTPLALPSTLDMGAREFGRVITNSSQTANPISLQNGITTNEWSAFFVGSFENYTPPGYNSFFKSASGGYGLKFMNVGSGSANFSMVLPGVAYYGSGVPVVSGAPYSVMFLGVNGGTMQVVARRLDTGEVFVSTPVSIGSPSTDSGTSYLLSEETAGYGSNGGSTLALAGFSPRLLSVSEALVFVENPWQIFEDEEEFVFRAGAAGGSTLNASASGGDSASGSALLAAQVALSAVGISNAYGSGNIAASVPLSAVGFSLSIGTANARATVTISADGLAQAAGQAGLSASVLLAAAGAAQAAGNAALATKLNALADGAAQSSGTANLTGGAPGALSASGGDVASGSAVLSVTVGLQAAGGDVASGTANGQVGSPGSISATGGAQSSGSATWSATARITAAGFVQAMGAGQWSTTVSLSAFASSSASGSATLAEVGAVLLVPTRGFSITGQRRNFSLSGQRRIYRVSS